MPAKNIISEMYDELRKIIEEADREHPIVFFGGAGVSTESGIPDFRSENGLYNAKSEYGFAPEDMISHDFFENEPFIFFDYYKKNLIAKDAKPNKAHYALAKLEEQGKLSAVITQNIDNLHQMAGSKKVYELHGSVHRNNCVWCRKFYGLDYILDENNCEQNKKNPKMLGVPKCSCGGVIKPDVVLYGEMLDENCIAGAVAAIQSADTLIIGGTSLAVYPAAGFVNYFRGRHLVVINKAATGMDGSAEIVIHDPIGEVLGSICK